ncbi:hypothetical protein N7462_000742 [Penicillium macrosclerotiorum]|uniref:uncharacterized protein n=1 Tax=Penicillium macrosclerotiorum TaxID=303699 RepID=UPI002548920A|nr:uncharacterized protein N7462_000742 [Penicillium macrosclerotiorum]KAJ5698737.1 hypothetical protein N7462_000742 [Penicillium macrosclerotiorum]
MGPEVEETSPNRRHSRANPAGDEGTKNQVSSQRRNEWPPEEKEQREKKEAQVKTNGKKETMTAQAETEQTQRSPRISPNKAPYRTDTEYLDKDVEVPHIDMDCSGVVQVLTELAECTSGRLLPTGSPPSGRGCT